MNRDDTILSAWERLAEALAADLLDAAEDEVLASDTPAAARVAADALRRRLRAATLERRGAPEATDPPSRPAPDLHHRPGGKP